MGENIAIRDAYGAALKELGEQNEKIVGLEADVASSTKSGIFGKAFPERYFNVGISELDMVSMSAGFAREGLIPGICESHPQYDGDYSGGRSGDKKSGICHCRTSGTCLFKAQPRGSSCVLS